jgi:hypothetical protein
VSLQFIVTTAGLLTSISYYRDASEPCTGHVGKIFEIVGGVGKTYEVTR